MGRPSKSIIENRDYELNPDFPILLLSGERWHISDIPSNRLHFHDCLEIGICHEGGGVLEFEDRSLHFTTGDITCIGHYVPHTTFSDKGTSSLWSWIFLDPDSLLAYQFGKGIDSDSIDELLQDYSRLIHAGNQPMISMLVHGIIDELQNKRPYYPSAVRGMTLSLLTNLLRLVPAEQRDAPSSRPRNALVIAPALEYIRTEYMQDFSIEGLAELCHLSPTHFRRMFHNIMHCNPLEYVNSVRIKHACDLLRSTELSVLSVSERVGFVSVSSFNRHFSQINGCTPTSWRRNMTRLPHFSVFEHSGWM